MESLCRPGGTLEKVFYTTEELNIIIKKATVINNVLKIPC